MLEQFGKQMQRDNTDDAKEDLQEFKKAVEEGKSDPIIGTELKSLDAMIRDIGDDRDIQHQLNQSFSGLHRKLVTISTIVLENQTIEQATIKENEIEIDEDQILGSGGFGQVLLGRYKGALLVACKRVQQVNSMEAFKMQDDLRREAMVWKNLDHKNIVKLHGTCIFNHQLVLAMERCDLSLDHFIHERQQTLTFPEMETIMRGMARGMSYLHSKNIIHRDIKPMNVLLSHDLGKVKLTDFGLATIKQEYASYAQTAAAPKGTWLYMAPEILDDEGAKWTTRADVYSFAVVCWEMLHRRLPWDGKMDQLKAYKRIFVKGERPKFADDVPIVPWMRSMIETAWSQSIRQRPTASELVKLIESKSTQRRSTKIVQGLFGRNLKRFSWTMKQKETPEQMEQRIRKAAEERARQETERAKQEAKLEAERAKREAERTKQEAQQARKLAEEKARKAEERAKKLEEKNMKNANNFAKATAQELNELEKINNPQAALVTIMKKYPYDAEVQAKAAKKIKDLARGNQDNKSTLMKMGAAEEIIKAMQLHRQNGDVQWNACGALWNLANNNDNQVTLMKMGAAEEIIKAMQLHRQNGDVQHYACGALLNIAANNDNNKVTLMKMGAAEEIIKAMQLHRRNGDVQHWACWALLNLAFNENNRVTLMKMGADKEARTALGNHKGRQDVQAKAKGLLNKLGVRI